MQNFHNSRFNSNKKRKDVHAKNQVVKKITVNVMLVEKNVLKNANAKIAIIIDLFH